VIGEIDGSCVLGPVGASVGSNDGASVAGMSNPSGALEGAATKDGDNCPVRKGAVRKDVYL
jgi:outer membrane lipoprotein SlyB